MCAEWVHDFAAFLRDMGPRPDGHTLDRVDVNGNYEPGNCRWATLEQQENNRRDNRVVSFRGEQFTVAELSRRLGINEHTLWGRLKRRGFNADGCDFPVDMRRGEMQRRMRRHLIPA